MRPLILAVGAAALLAVAPVGSVAAGNGPAPYCSVGNVGVGGGASGGAPYAGDFNPGITPGITVLCHPLGSTPPHGPPAQ